MYDHIALHITHKIVETSIFSPLIFSKPPLIGIKIFSRSLAFGGRWRRGWFGAPVGKSALRWWGGSAGRSERDKRPEARARVGSLVRRDVLGSWTWGSLG